MKSGNGWIVLAWLLLAGAAKPKTYYSDGRSGRDSASGLSPDQPFETLARGLQPLAPGDTLKVASGVYYELMAVAASGTPEQPIVIVGNGTTRPMVKNLDDAISIT